MKRPNTDRIGHVRVIQGKTKAVKMMVVKIGGEYQKRGGKMKGEVDWI